MKSIRYSDLADRKQASFDKVGKVSSDSVEKHTGKSWAQWMSILERAGARSWTYQEIVSYLKTKQRLTPWWQQGVALGFEIATGRRQEGQDAKGKYMVTATKSLPCSAPVAWRYLMSDAGLSVWLQPLSKIKVLPQVQFETADGYFGEIRTVAKNRRARLFWQDPEWPKHTVLEVMLVPRPGQKSILVFNHSGIHELKTQIKLRERWKKSAGEIIVALSKD